MRHVIEALPSLKACFDCVLTCIDDLPWRRGAPRSPFHPSNFKLFLFLSYLSLHLLSSQKTADNVVYVEALGELVGHVVRSSCFMTTFRTGSDLITYRRDS